MDLKKKITTVRDTAYLMAGGALMLTFYAAASVPIVISNASQKMVDKAFN